MKRSRQSAIWWMTGASSDRAREIRIGTYGEDDEIERESAGFGFNRYDVSLVLDRVPCAVGVPHEIFEFATAPEGILWGWLCIIIKNVAHKSPAFQVGQLSEVTKHAREMRPEEWIDAGNIGTAEAKVDPCGSSFQHRRRVIESSGAAAEYAHALSRKAAEVYVVGRIGIKFRGQVGDEVLTSPPASAAFHTGREDNLSGIDAFDPAFPTEMSEEKITGRLNRSDFDLVIDLKLQNIAVPIEIFPPYLRGKGVDALPGLATESRLVPSTGCKARDAKVDARHVLRCA